MEKISSLKYGNLSFVGTLPETNIAPEDWWLDVVGKLLSFWEGIFSGAMLVYQSVSIVFVNFRAV